VRLRQRFRRGGRSALPVRRFPAARPPAARMIFAPAAVRQHEKPAPAAPLLAGADGRKPRRRQAAATACRPRHALSAGAAQVIGARRPGARRRATAYHRIRPFACLRMHDIPPRPCTYSCWNCQHLPVCAQAAAQVLHVCRLPCAVFTPDLAPRRPPIRRHHAWLLALPLTPRRHAAALRAMLRMSRCQRRLLVHHPARPARAAAAGSSAHSMRTPQDMPAQPI